MKRDAFRDLRPSRGRRIGGRILRLVLLAWIVLAGAAASTAQDPAAERLLREAERLAEAGDLVAAAGQLALLVSRFPQDPARPQALLRSARLERARGDIEAAKSALETLIGEHPRAPEAAEALVLQAELALRAATSSRDMAEAQNLYRRVVLLFGKNAYPALAARRAARIESGRLAIALGDPAAAAAELVGAIEDEPTGPGVGHARLALARAWIAAGNWREAAAALEKVVAGGAPSAEEGADAEARRLLSLIHRRVLRPLAGGLSLETAGRFPLSGVELREPSGVAASPDGRLLVVDGRLPLVAVFDARGREVSRQPLGDVDRPGWMAGGRRPFVVGAGGVVAPFDATSYAFTDPEKAAPLKNLQAAAPGSFGDWFVLAKGTKGVIHADAGSESKELLSAGRPDFVDLARDTVGRIHALDSRSAQVMRISRDGEEHGSVLSGDWKKAVALDIDDLGYFYVLDRGERAVTLYAPDGRRLSTVGPELGGGIELRNPVDVAVDGGGRLFIADTRLPFIVTID